MSFGAHTYAVLLGLYLGVKLLGLRVRTGSAPADTAEVLPANTPTRSTEHSSCYMSLPTCGDCQSHYFLTMIHRFTAIEIIESNGSFLPLK